MASIKKRGKTWYVRFSKRETQWDPEKQKNVSVLKQKSKGGFKTKAEAQQYGIKMEAASIDGVDVTKNPVFADYMQKWFETYKKPNCSPATSTKYNYEINLVRNYFGDLTIKDITRTKYQEFINFTAKKHAPVTVKKLNGSVRACVNSAIIDGLISADFTKQVQVHGNEDRELAVTYLNVDEIKRLTQTTINELDINTPSRHMILTAIFTGARLGEISGLQWSDIDFTNNIIDINKSYSWQRKKIGPTKNKSSIRKIKVNDFLLERLNDLKANKCKFVFGNPAENELPPTSATANSTLRSLLKDANINKDIHFHSLRHIHVAYLIKKHVDIVAISQRLGHSNVATTLKYYAYLIDELKKSEDNKIISDLNELSK